LKNLLSVTVVMELTLDISLAYVKEMHRHKVRLIVPDNTIDIIFHANVPKRNVATAIARSYEIVSQRLSGKLLFYFTKKNTSIV